MAEQGATQPAQAQTRQPGLESEMRPQPDFRPRYPGGGRLRAKVAIVTGGDSGIGRAVAVLFAREGAHLVIGYLDEHGDAEETVRLVEEEGGRAVAVSGDIGEPRTAERLVAAALDNFGRIDVVVNNAAEQHEQETIEDIDVAQLERTFRTNIFGMFHLTKAALPHLGTGAAIVNSASVTAYKGKAELLDYTSSKGAIVSFTRGLANQLVERGIRVNAVAPGPIWTPLIPASFSPEETAEHGAHAPMKRVGQPNEVAPSYLFLACEDASYMTGQVLHPNGGTIVNG